MRYDIWVGTDRYDEGKGRKVKKSNGEKHGNLNGNYYTLLVCTDVQLYIQVDRWIAPVIQNLMGKTGNMRWKLLFRVYGLGF